MRVLALDFGGTDCASSSYRILQYQQPLRQFGVFLDAGPAGPFTDWPGVRSYDAVIVQKKLFSIGRVRQLRRAAKKLVYDLDDAIWHPHDRPHHWLTNWRTALRVKAIARSADLCLAANHVLAAHLRRWNSRTTVLPMALDGVAWHPQAGAGEGRLRAGWAGAPVNLKYLEGIETALVKVRQAHPHLEIVVFSGRQPRFVHGLAYTYVPFEPGQEPAVVRGFDIGLLPLPSNAFAQGKSPIKGLQYLATGIPSVVSPRAAAREMFHGTDSALFADSEAEWVAALGRLAGDAGLRIALGRQARAHFEASYSRERNAKTFADLLGRL